LPLASVALRAGERVRTFAPRRRAEGREGHRESIAVAAEEGDGRLVLVFAARRELLDAELGWDDAWRDALGRVIAAGFAQVRALSRVASLSRRAHGDRERLLGDLERAALAEETAAASAVMRRLLGETVPLVATQDVTVLLWGESGTGKELVARRIHALSRRARRPFVTVNAAALPETLADSALFGHEKGAFTGATQRHLGVFERAHGGTLLLDEVGDLAAATQVRLLRVLQEGEFERVGGASPVRVDVRVIAATHQPLEQMIADGRFRADLFYRLAVVPLVVPPLRERREDVAGLTAVLLRRHAARFGREVPAVGVEALRRLRAYGWPGNVRELENVLQRALVMTTGDALALPDDFDAVAPAAGAGAGAEDFAEAQRRVIREALRAAEGRVYGPTGAAARLGLAPTTLRSKMDRLGMARPGR
ncbi:MAG: acetoacetate metabolism regulatory protein AtoC, partial [Myxococcaceae bacterium]|nr:acetoacetate metabolism regulatory protein AtoC [Myxococcaceae bacterium]